MFRQCYTTVSDLALCQRCPALLGYKIHRREMDAWREGIKGKGFYYGSMFHENISLVFFEAASDAEHRLHASLARSIAGGLSSLESFVRENIFMPFVEKHSRSYSSGQIMAAAEGITVWVKAIYQFFSEIPSLMKNPGRTMNTVFITPEQKLQAAYDLPNGEGRLIVTGQYDALIFNPDKAEARLFEFKGYSKTDAVVPLSQSVIYAWLIEKFSGIVPSVEIIYLDEKNRKPDIFSSDSVKGMIRSSLPGLFYTAFNTITLRRLPEIMKDNDLCGTCRFKNDCASDRAVKFRRRKGASMVSVIVFMVASLMITAHIFFFSTMSAETNALQVSAMQNRFRFDRALDTAIDKIKESVWSDNSDPAPAAAFADHKISGRPSIIIKHTDGSRVSFDNYKGFHDDTVTIKKKYDLSDNVHVCIYDLHYTYIADNVKVLTIAAPGKNWNKVDKDKRVFPPMYKEGDKRYYLIRISRTPSNKSQKKSMRQVLVEREGTAGNYTVKPLSFQEVWYE